MHFMIYENQLKPIISPLSIHPSIHLTSSLNLSIGKQAIQFPLGVHSIQHLYHNHPRELACAVHRKFSKRRTPVATRWIREFPPWGPTSLEPDDPLRREGPQRGYLVTWETRLATPPPSTYLKSGGRELRREK